MIPELHWTTLLEHNGPEVIHLACFVPSGYPGHGPIVSVLLPDRQIQFLSVGQDGEPVATVDCPHGGPEACIKIARERAASEQVALFLTCDTPERVEMSVKIAVKHLPNYKRMPLERLYGPEDLKRYLAVLTPTIRLRVRVVA